jgi:hypothetical protein
MGWTSPLVPSITHAIFIFNCLLGNYLAHSIFKKGVIGWGLIAAPGKKMNQRPHIRKLIIKREAS